MTSARRHHDGVSSLNILHRVLQEHFDLGPWELPPDLLPQPIEVSGWAGVSRGGKCSLISPAPRTSPDLAMLIERLLARHTVIP